MIVTEPPLQVDDFRVSFAVEVGVVNVCGLDPLDLIKASVDILCSQIISESQVQLLANNFAFYYFVDHANS